MRPLLRLRSDRVLWRAVRDEIVALDLDGEKYVSANRAAAMLWPALARGTTSDDLVRTLVDHFGVDAEAARRDVDAFLEDLRGRGLLEA